MVENPLKRYAETVPTGIMAQMALADMDLAAVTPGTEVHLINGTPVTIVGDADVSWTEMSAAIESVRSDMKELFHDPPARLAA